MSVRKPMTWEYKGDMRCPECGRYAPVMTNGRGHKLTIRLHCKYHGSFIKDVNTGWKRPQEFFTERERAHKAELDYITSQLKGDKKYAFS